MKRTRSTNAPGNSESVRGHGARRLGLMLAGSVVWSLVASCSTEPRNEPSDGISERAQALSSAEPSAACYSRGFPAGFSTTNNGAWFDVKPGGWFRRMGWTAGCLLTSFSMNRLTDDLLHPLG